MLKAVFINSHLYLFDNTYVNIGFRSFFITILWRILRISKKVPNDYSPGRRFFLMTSSHIYPDRRNSKYSIGERLLWDGKEKLPSYADESLYRHAYHSSQTPLPHRPL